MSEGSIVTIIVAVLSSGILSTLINRIFARRDKKKEKETGLQAGLRELLYDRIKEICKVQVSCGTITEEDYKSLQRMWKVYHEELEGNGYLDSWMKKIEGLPKK